MVLSEVKRFLLIYCWDTSPRVIFRQKGIFLINHKTSIKNYYLLLKQQYLYVNFAEIKMR